MATELSENMSTSCCEQYIVYLPGETSVRCLLCDQSRLIRQVGPLLDIKDTDDEE